MIGFIKQKVKTGHIFCAVLVLCALVFTACPNPSGPSTKTALAAPRSVQVRESDFTLTWAEVNDAVEYRVDINGEQAIITRNRSYSLEEKLAAKSGVYEIEVKALAGNSSQFTDSAYSDAIEVEPPEYIFEYDEEEENTLNIRAARAAAGNLAISGLTDFGKTLNNVVIPVSIDGGTVRSILANAFADNNNIESIVIAATITKIEAGAFSDCTALATITFAATENDEILEIEIDNGAFSNISDEVVVVVPDGSDDSFKEKIEEKIPDAEIKEEAQVVAVSGVTLSPKTLSLDVGGTETLTVTIAPANADDKRVRWSSNNTNVATVTVNNAGTATVTAIASGTAVITVTTVDGTHTDTCTVTVKPIAGDPAKFIEAAFLQLKAGNYDAAIASFEAAYNADPNNNEAIAYSSLAKLAAISTDAKVATLLKSKLGLKSYPQTMNALLDPSWLEEYKGTTGVDNYQISESAYGQYVRVTGNVVHWNSSENITDYWYALATEYDDSLDWVNYYEYEEYFLDDYFNGYIQVTGFSDNGEYLIYYYNVQNHPELPANVKRYNVEWDDSVLILDESGSSFAPEFNIPKWFEDSDMYTSSLVGGLQTVDTLMYLLMANALEGNSAGLNGLLDGILDSVFGASFEAACSRIAELDMNERVEIPAELIEGLGLGFILEEGFEAEIGRAELQALTSALRLIKGTLQWIASYNLDSDLSFMKFDWATIDSVDDVISRIESKHDPFANGFLNARNNDSMAASKESFKKALTDINESYDYLVSDANTSYPQYAKDTMKDYCTLFREGVGKLVAAINNGSKFHVSYNAFGNLSGTWPDSNGDIIIDMGQFFTPGLFTLDKLVEAENKKPVFYIRDNETGEERKMTAADVTAIKNLPNELIAAEEAAELKTDEINSKYEEANAIYYEIDALYDDLNNYDYDSDEYAQIIAEINELSEQQTTLDEEINALQEEASALWDEVYQLEDEYNSIYAGFRIKTSPMTTVVTIKELEMPPTMLVNFGPDFAAALYEYYW